jgi:hypothetical protein
MKGMPALLKENSAGLCFYGCLFLGILLFAGFMSAALMLLLLGTGSHLLKSPLSKILEKASAVTSLVIRSLLSLGLFPFLWLAGRLLAGKRGLWLAGLILILGFLFSLRHRGCRNETQKPDCGETVLALLLVIFLTWLPFSKIGSPLNGKYAYRAYFSSDYLKHYAVVEALNKGSIPPPNLYFKGEALHYYWLPYTVPAALSQLTDSTPQALFAFSFSVNFLFILMLLKLAGRMFPRRRELPLLTVLLALMPSLEGFYLWAFRFHFSLAAYFQAGHAYNIDGLTRWLWALPQIDVLFRTLLYTPQHLLSLAFLVMFLYFFSAEKEHPGVLSFCLALSLAASFFVGGIFLFSWGVYWLGREGIRIVRKKPSSKALGTDFLQLFIPPAVVLALSFVLKMVTFKGGGIFFTALTPGHMIILLSLNMGLLVIGGVAGLVLGRFPGRSFYSTLLIVSLIFVLFVRIENFESDISLKAGLVAILLLTLSMGFLTKHQRAGKLYLPLVCLIILPGLLTLVLDIWNSADIHNARFTSTISFEEMQLIEWIRSHVPVDQTVQDYPPARARNLSAIPVFSGHQMLVGDRMHGRIFQTSPAAYDERIQALGRTMSSLPSSREELRRMGVDYLLWGVDENRHFKYTPDLPVAWRAGQTVLFSLAPKRTESP